MAVTTGSETQPPEGTGLSARRPEGGEAELRLAFNVILASCTDFNAAHERYGCQVVSERYPCMDTDIAT